MEVITDAAIQRRKYWVAEIEKISENFGENSERLENELSAEIKKEGPQALLDHLRLSGDIPESYGHDTSEEKQYSKYTDALLSETYKAIGLRSLVIKERADAADGPRGRRRQPADYRDQCGNPRHPALGPTDCQERDAGGRATGGGGIHDGDPESPGKQF